MEEDEDQIEINESVNPLEEGEVQPVNENDGPLVQLMKKVKLSEEISFQTDKLENMIIPAEVFGGSVDVRVYKNDRKIVVMDMGAVVMALADTPMDRNNAGQFLRRMRKIDGIMENIQEDLFDDESKFM